MAGVSTLPPIATYSGQMTQSHSQFQILMLQNQMLLNQNTMCLLQLMQHLNTIDPHIQQQQMIHYQMQNEICLHQISCMTQYHQHMLQCMEQQQAAQQSEALHSVAAPFTDERDLDVDVSHLTEAVEIVPVTTDVLVTGEAMLTKPINDSELVVTTITTAAVIEQQLTETPQRLCSATFLMQGSLLSAYSNVQALTGRDTEVSMMDDSLIHVLGSDHQVFDPGGIMSKRRGFPTRNMDDRVHDSI